MSTFMFVGKALLGLVIAVGFGACEGNGVGDVSCARDGITLEDGTTIRDVVCGDGVGADRGMSATVAYTASVGDETDEGTVFDRSGPLDLTFRLGAGQVVTGWDEGLVGMRVGGTRTLVVPSELAYGEAGLAPHVPPGATVTYEVELLELTDRRD